MNFVEPKVEFVKISTTDVVVASAGGYEYCEGSGSECSVEAMQNNNKN